MAFPQVPHNEIKKKNAQVDSAIILCYMYIKVERNNFVVMKYNLVIHTRYWSLYITGLIILFAVEFGEDH